MLHGSRLGEARALHTNRSREPSLAACHTRKISMQQDLVVRRRALSGSAHGVCVVNAEVDRDHISCALSRTSLPLHDRDASGVVAELEFGRSGSYAGPGVTLSHVRLEVAAGLVVSLATRHSRSVTHGTLGTANGFVGDSVDHHRERLSLPEGVRAARKEEEERIEGHLEWINRGVFCDGCYRCCHNFRGRCRFIENNKGAIISAQPFASGAPSSNLTK